MPWLEIEHLALEAIDDILGVRGFHRARFIWCHARAHSMSVGAAAVAMLMRRGSVPATNAAFAASRLARASAGEMVGSGPITSGCSPGKVRLMHCHN